MAADKIESWNLDEHPQAAGGLKDITPGDQVDRRRALNEAYTKMGTAMASELREDAAYKEDTKNMLSNISVIAGQSGISEGFDGGKHSMSTNSDKGIIEYFIFLIASILQIIFKPRFHKPSAIQLIIGLVCTIAVLVVISMILHDSPNAILLIR